MLWAINMTPLTSFLNVVLGLNAKQIRQYPRNVLGLSQDGILGTSLV